MISILPELREYFDPTHRLPSEENFDLYGPLKGFRPKHEIFRPIYSSKNNSEVTANLSIPLPVERLLMHMNGAHFFYGAISFHGVRQKNDGMKRGSRQPFDIEIYNSYERPPCLEASEFVFGTYFYENSLLSIHGREVRKRLKDTLLISDHWPSMNEMLRGEFLRLSTVL